MKPTELEEAQVASKRGSPGPRAALLVAVTLAAAALFMFFFLVEKPFYRLGQIAVPSVLAALAVSWWARRSKQRWPWWRTVLVYAVFLAAISALTIKGISAAALAPRYQTPSDFIDSGSSSLDIPDWAREALASPPGESAVRQNFSAVLKPDLPDLADETALRGIAYRTALLFSLNDADAKKARSEADALRFVDMRNSPPLSRFLRLRAFIWKIDVRSQAYAVYGRRAIYFLRPAGDASVLLHEIMHWLKDVRITASDLPVNYAIQGYASEGRLPPPRDEAHDGLAQVRSAAQNAETALEQAVHNVEAEKRTPEETMFRLALTLSEVEARLTGMYRKVYLAQNKGLAVKIDGENIYTAATGLLESVAVRKMEAALSKRSYDPSRFAPAFFLLRSQLFDNHDQLYMDARANHDELQFTYLLSALLAMRPDLAPSADDLRRFIASYPSVSEGNAARIAAVARAVIERINSQPASS